MNWLLDNGKTITLLDDEDLAALRLPRDVAKDARTMREGESLDHNGYNLTKITAREAKSFINGTGEWRDW